MDADRDATRIAWLPWPGDLDDVGYRAATDYHMANMEQAIRQLGVSPRRPVEVRLRHATPRDTAGYLAFYGIEPRFGSPRYELVYAPDLRDVGVTTFNSSLRDYFARECLLADVRGIREALSGARHPDGERGRIPDRIHGATGVLQSIQTLDRTDPARVSRARLTLRSVDCWTRSA